MDQGAIRSLKAKYRILLVKKLIGAIDHGKPFPKVYLYLAQ